MKQLKCSKCSKIWYVDDADLNSVNTCPFCSSQIRCKGTIGNIDTLGKAIYQAISTGGLDLLTSSERISGYLMDLLPDQRKEIRISLRHSMRIICLCTVMLSSRQKMTSM